jgi:ABC-2 type transport system ATP-binding protein
MTPNVIEIDHVSKNYGDIEAVKEVSFEVEQGEIFAMLGPNGAGKTTTIRMILDIIKPDSGSIRVLGGPITDEKKDRIGYLPEERGLYKSVPVQECLAYLGTLKGMSRSDANQRAAELLEEFELDHAANMKTEELSKGMLQKAQIAMTLLHRPEIIIIDEPFSGLDPVNTRLIKDRLYEVQQEGTTIIMSTHQMRQVEEMAHRLFMMNKGRRVLYGPVEDVRNQYALDAVIVEGKGDFAKLPGVERVTTGENNKEYTLTIKQGYTSDDILRQLGDDPDIVVYQFSQAIPSLDDIFVEVVQGNGHE